MTPESGNGALRAIGLFKAFQVQSIVSQCRGGTLHRQGAKDLLSQKLCNPTWSEKMVEEVLKQTYDAMDLSSDAEVGFEALAQAMTTVDQMSVDSQESENETSNTEMMPSPSPFTLKNIFSTIREAAVV